MFHMGLRHAVSHVLDVTKIYSTWPEVCWGKEHYTHVTLQSIMAIDLLI